MPKGIRSLRDVPPSTPDSGGELEPSNRQDWGCGPTLRGHASASQDQPLDSVPPSWDLPDKPYNKMTERRAGGPWSKGTLPVRGQLFREASGAQGGAADTFGSREVSTPAITEQTVGSWGHCDEQASAIREGSRATWGAGWGPDEPGDRPVQPSRVAPSSMHSCGPSSQETVVSAPSECRFQVQVQAPCTCWEQRLLDGQETLTLSAQQQLLPPGFTQAGQAILQPLHRSGPHSERSICGAGTTSATGLEQASPDQPLLPFCAPTSVRV